MIIGHLHDFLPKGRQRLVAAARGAMGDFLNAWPTLAALAEAAPPGSLVLDAKEDHHFWAAPLGYARPDPDVRKGLNALYGDGPWPRGLAGHRVLFLGLAEKDPFAGRHPGLAYVSGLDKQGYEPPRKLYARALAAMGLARPGDGRKRFAELFGPAKGLEGGARRALLFPGAGHRTKRWAMVKYFELAEKLRHMGLEPMFVLGPVEREQGLDTGGFPCLAPENSRELTAAMKQSALAVGNDCGPMHLAGALGLPGAVLFGPTSARQWGPPGLVHVRGQAPCRPCTRTTADLDCRDPVCMRSITTAMAAEAVAGLLSRPPK